LKTRLLKYISAILICFFPFVKGFGQEVPYSNGGLNYYWNPFETAAPASDIGSFVYRNTTASNYTFTSTNSQTALNGSYSLSTVNRNVATVTNGISKQLLGTGVSYNGSTTYEWAILYKYSTSDAATSSDIVDYPNVVAGKCGWRYWFAAKTSTPTAQNDGFFMTQVGKELRISAPSQGVIYTATVEPNITYSIKFKIINGSRVVVYMNAYSPLKTEASTKVLQTNFGITMSSYSYTVLEANEARSATYHCQWDDIKLYIPTFTVNSITALSNGLNNSTLSQGQDDAIVYGFSIVSRGAFNIKEIDVDDDLGNSQQALSGAKLYSSTDNNFSTTADQSLNTYTVPSSGALNFATTTLNLGGTDQAGTVYNFFYTIDLLPNAKITSLQFKNLQVQYDNNNGYVTAISPATDGTAYTIAQAYTWAGGTSTSFNTASNWRLLQIYNNAITPALAPGASNYVYIPGTAINSPTASLSDVNIAGLTIDAGKSLTLSDVNLTVSNLLSSSGTIAFTGSLPNTFTINAGAYTNLANLSIIKTVKSTTLTLASSNSSKLNLTSTLNLQNATLATAGLLTLKSSSTVTASVSRLDQTTAGTIDAAITGNVIAERYVTGGSGYNQARSNYTYRNYRVMSSPVYTTSSSPNVYNFNYINNSAIVTGATGGYGPTTANPTLYLYREDFAGTTTSFTSGNFRAVTDVSTNTYPGTGFLFYFRGDKLNNLTAKTTTPFTAPESVVFANTGTLNQGSITAKNWQTGSTTLLRTATAASVSYGINLLGNPYASSINWDNTAGFTTTNISSTIYLFNPVTNQFDTYVRGNNGVGTGGSSQNIIASGQGFFVKVENTATPATTPTTGTLTFNEAAKSSSQLSGLNLLLGMPVVSEQAAGFIRLRLSLDSLNHDNVVIAFRDGTNEKFNAQEDATDLGGSGAYESLSVLSSDSVALAISSTPFVKKQQTIGLMVNATASGLYSLSLNELKNLAPVYEVWLKDNLKKDSLDLRSHPSYNFNIDKTKTTTFGKNRFQIVIRQNPAMALRLLDFSATKVTEGALLSWITENESNYTNFTVERSINGGKAFEVIGGFKSSDLGKYSMLDNAPVKGLNQYRLKQDDINGTITYSKVVNLTYSKATDNITINNLSVYPNPVNSTVNIAITPQSDAASYTIKITGDVGTLVKSATSTQPTWQDNVSGLRPGTYFVQVINNSTKAIVGNGKFIKL
jgi:hypothetical protein